MWITLPTYKPAGVAAASLWHHTAICAFIHARQMPYSPYSWVDHQYEEQTLYRKQTGEFFLYEKGNAASRYAERRGPSTWTGGTQITLLKEDEAREWVSEYLDADTFLRFFEAQEEPTKITINLCQSAQEALERLAKEQNKSISEVVEELVMKKEI